MFLGPDMVSEGLVCSQVWHSECPQGCVPFGFGLRDIIRYEFRVMSYELPVASYFFFYLFVS